MPRPIQARIDLSALRHNCARVRSQTPSARVWAVLKADAYGHGLLRVARSLAANVEGFAVLELSAAITLRNAGLKHPIMLLEGCFEPADLQLCAEYGLTPAVHHLEQLRMFASVRLPAPLPVYLKINTGMNRLGFTAPELPALQAMIEASGETVVVGGLLDKSVTDTADKVPLLGDIPLVGQLFRYTSQDTSKRNLMVFIHTTVLRDDDNYSAASKEKYDQIRVRQMQRVEEKKLGIIEPSDNAVLPAFPGQGSTTAVKASASTPRNPFKE